MQSKLISDEIEPIAPKTFVHQPALYLLASALLLSIDFLLSGAR
jgi:hypothetical protein